LSQQSKRRGNPPLSGPAPDHQSSHK
jgi:hypothetical protein